MTLIARQHFLICAHETVEEIGYEKHSDKTSEFADLFIFFKTKESMEQCDIYKLIPDGFGTLNYWAPRFHMRITFSNQKAKPHESLDKALKIAESHFGLVLTSAKSSENRES